MHYINNPNSPAKTYQQVMDVAINNGVEPKRVYIYLASLGVRGELTRIFDGNQYGEPVKMAITGKSTLVNEVGVCGHCGGLVINRGNQERSVESVTPVQPVTPTDPAFNSWLLLSANEYKSAEDAYEVSSLNKSMDIEEFTQLFNQHYTQNNKGQYTKG